MLFSTEQSKTSEMSLRFLERRQKTCAARRCKTLIRKADELNKRYGTEAYIELKEDGYVFSFSTPNYRPYGTHHTVMPIITRRTHDTDFFSPLCQLLFNKTADRQKRD